MSTAMVDVPTPDGVADAYLVRPDGVGPYPGVLVYMDAFGLRPRLAEMAGRIAERGYAVLVPNLLHRAGRAPLFDTSGLKNPETRAELVRKIMPLIRALDTPAVTRDTGAYLDFLAAQEGVADGPAAIVGYCMGARNALKAIEAYPDRIRAMAGFHGARYVTDEPDSPHLVVGRVTGELYLGHADNDPGNTPEQIEALEKALDSAGVRHTSEVYEGATHGFTMADSAVFDAAAEQRHWENLFALLDRTVGAR
jgi:carboxymethylenebutenolidase